MAAKKQEDMTLDEKLKAIEEAVRKANGDTKKEEKFLSGIVDPQDSLNCEGCQ